jgi:hypothetical protein
VVVIGCLLAAAGLALWASQVTKLSLGSQWYFIVLSGLGLGMMVGPANTDAINQVGRTSYGEATGITQTTRNFGASFGLAALGTLLVTVERDHLVTALERLGLPGAAAHSTASSLSSTHGSGGAPAGVPAALARHVFHAAQVSLGEGMRAVLYAMAAVMALAALVAAAGLRRGIHAAHDASAAPLGSAPATEGAAEAAAEDARP